MRIALFAVALVGVASAQYGAGLLCCGTKACPEGTTQVGPDQCCADPQDSGTCAAVANLGRRCNGVGEAVTGIPDRGNVAGCVEIQGVVCVGGQIGDDSGPVAGCVCVGDACEADFDFPNGKPNCTAIAVDACCDAGACT